MWHGVKHELAFKCRKSDLQARDAHALHVMLLANTTVMGGALAGIAAKKLQTEENTACGQRHIDGGMYHQPTRARLAPSRPAIFSSG